MDRLVDFLLNFSGPTPYVMVFAILVACGLGLPVPEDITLFAAGLASYYGLTNVFVMMILSFVGVLVGDSLIFWLGATYGRKLTKKWLFHKLLPDERLNRVRSRFNKEGNKLIFFGRFTPGFRAPVFFSAGVLHVPYREFLYYDGGAALVSVPLIIGAVYYFGDQLDKVVRVIQRVEHGLLFVVAAVFLAILGKWYVTHRRLRRT